MGRRRHELVHGSELTNLNDLGLVYCRNWTVSLQKWAQEASHLTGKDSEGDPVPDAEGTKNCFGKDQFLSFSMALRTEWGRRSSKGYREGSNAGQMERMGCQV